MKNIFNKLETKVDKKEIDGFKELLNEMREELSRLIEAAKDQSLDLGRLKDRIELLEAKIANFAKELEKLRNITPKGSGLGIDEQEWENIKTRVDALKREVEKILRELRDLSDLKNLRKLIMELQKALENKLDRDEFEKWKAANDFSQIINGMLKKFADKNEMLRALKKLEERILALEKALYDMQGNVGSADDALLAKKPLGGWSCASCQKDLINLEGMKVQYYPWAKLPQRDPAERIAKVGQGFSRMLSMLKPEMVDKSPHAGLMKKAYNKDSIEEEDTKPMGRSQTQGSGIGAEFRRPNTANVLPHIQQRVFLYVIL